MATGVGNATSGDDYWVITVFPGGKRIMGTLDSAIQQDGTQPVRIADVCDVALGRLPGDSECDDMVTRVIGRQQYTWCVDVAGFDSSF